MILYFLITLAATVLGSAAGMGGGVIIKPLMDLLGDYNIADISVLASVTVFSMAAFATFQQIARGLVVSHTLVWVTAGSVAGGVLGSLLFARLAASLDADIITAVQSGVLIILMTICLFYHRIPHRHIVSPVPVALIGAALGLFSSFLGIGGGPINVAVLGIFLSLELRFSARASVFIILFSQAAGLATKAFDGMLGNVADYSVLLVMVPAAIIGGLIGTRLNHTLPDRGIALLYRVSVLLVIAICVYNLIGAAVRAA